MMKAADVINENTSAASNTYIADVIVERGKSQDLFYFQWLLFILMGQKQISASLGNFDES